EHFQPHPALPDHPRTMISVIAICADTEEEASRLATSSDLFYLSLRTGREQPYLPSVHTATTYPYTEIEQIFVAQNRQKRVIGTPEQVKEQLLQMADDYQADEVLINSPIHDAQARLRSYELIAQAFAEEMRGS